MKVWLKSVHSGKYLKGSLQYDRTDTDLYASGTGFDQMEVYTLVGVDGPTIVHGSKIVIRTANSLYLHPLQGGGQGVQLSLWGAEEETFFIERANGNPGVITTADIVTLKTRTGHYLTVDLRQKNKLGAQATSATSREHFSLEVIEHHGEPLNVVAFGDSIVWGQGLYNKDKFTYLTKQWLEGVTQRPTNLFVFAHSGATLEPTSADDIFRENQYVVRPDDETNLWKPTPPGEVNFSYPSIHEQVKSASIKLPRWHHVSPEKVDLILIDGGINDLGPVTICTPFSSEGWIIEQTAQAVKRAKAMIVTTLKQYPHAKILITDYYQILSWYSNPMILKILYLFRDNFSSEADLSASMIAASAQPDIAMDEEILKNFTLEQIEDHHIALLYNELKQSGLLEKLEELGELDEITEEDTLIASSDQLAALRSIKQRMITNCQTFARKMNAGLLEIAQEFSERVQVAECGYDEKNAVLAYDTALWGLAPFLQPEDPVRAERFADAIKWGKSVGHGRAKTKIASLGHPHVKGARKYASSIRNTLQRTGWLVDIRDLAQRIFKQILQREASAHDIEDMRGQFLRGATVKDVIIQKATSEEFWKSFIKVDERTAIFNMVYHLLGRKPRDYEYGKWPNFKDGENWKNVVKEIVGSKEYQERFGDWEVPSPGRNRIETGVYLFQYKEHEGTVALDHINANLETGTSPIWRHHWTKNWTIVQPFTFQGANYLAGYKAHSGEFFIDQYTFDFDGTKSVWKQTWTKNWSILQPFQMKDKQFLFGYRGRDGDFFIDELNNGLQGTNTKLKGRWTTGWSSVSPFYIGDEVYLFGYRSSDGKYFIDQIKWDEKGFGLKSYSSGKRWSKGYSIVKPFYGTDGKVYIFGYRSGDGHYFIDRVNDDLSGTQSHGSGDWTSGWSSISPFYRDGHVYLFGYRNKDGKVFIDKINDDHNKSEDVMYKHWTTGWTTVIPAFSVEE